MNKEQQMVKEFMQVFGQECPESPVMPEREVTDFRLRLIEEEFDELDRAFMNEDKEETADALADLLYVVYGTAVACGIDIEEVFKEVHRSNMSKMWSSAEVDASDNKMDKTHQFKYLGTTIDKWIVTRNDGKIIKSPSWSPPNIKAILHNQIA